MKKKVCLKCGKCCKQSPCAVSVSDVKRIAKYFNLSTQELFKKYLVWVNHDDDYWVMPATNKLESGHGVWLCEAYQKQTCIFLKDNLCSIHKVKPYNCRVAYCKLKKTGKNFIWKWEKIKELLITERKKTKRMEEIPWTRTKLLKY